MPYNYSDLTHEETEIEMLKDAEKAIDAADMWTYIRETPVRADYSFCADPEFDKIGMYLHYPEHTSVTLAWTMKMMHKIANEGKEMSSHMITPSAPEKKGVERTPEMDEKVLKAYNNLEAFKTLPKWAKEYVRLYPQVLATRK